MGTPATGPKALIPGMGNGPGGLVRGLVWVDAYRSLDESGSDAGTEEEVAAMAPFRADFGAATRAFVWRIAGADTDPDLVDRIADDMAAAPPQIALDAMRHAISNERAAIAGLRQAPYRSWRSTLEVDPPISNHSTATASRR